MKHKKMIVLIVLCCIMSGCWDKVEIERKSFLSTIAIDTGEDIDKEKELKKIKSNEIFKEEKFNNIDVAFGFPNISELGPENGGTAKEEVIATKAFSMENSINELRAKTSRSIYTGHSKLLILSDKIVQYPETMKEIFDFLERQADINRMMLVVVVKGRSADYAKFVPTMEKNIQTYITGLMENGISNSSVVPVSLNNLLISLYENKSIAIPTIEFDKENKSQLNVSGVALIKDYKLQGYLTMGETASLQILRGKIKGGEENIILNGHPVGFEIRGINRTIDVTEDDVNNKLKFKINIELEGQLKQYYLEKDIFSKEDLQKIQDNFNDVIEKECERVARILQEQHPIDIIGLEEHIEKFKPKLYGKVKDKWEEVYKNSNIDVNVRVKVRRIGITK